MLCMAKVDGTDGTGKIMKANRMMFSKLISDRIAHLNLTIYGAAQLLAAETDEKVKTCHDRITGVINGRGISPDKLEEIIQALGGNLTVTWKE